jgi:hypothetical protein
MNRCSYFPVILTRGIDFWRGIELKTHPWSVSLSSNEKWFLAGYGFSGAFEVFCWFIIHEFKFRSSELVIKRDSTAFVISRFNICILSTWHFTKLNFNSNFKRIGSIPLLLNIITLLHIFCLFRWCGCTRCRCTRYRVHLSINPSGYPPDVIVRIFKFELED